MLQRFAAASLVVSVMIAIGAVTVLVLPGVTLAQASPVLAVWCCAPLLWGLWAMVAPGSWVPRLLPQWGSLLGLIAGSLGSLVLNLPQRILGQSWPLLSRLVAPLILAAVYYMLWTIVAAVYRRIAPPASAPTRNMAKAA